MFILTGQGPKNAGMNAKAGFCRSCHADLIQRRRLGNHRTIWGQAMIMARSAVSHRMKGAAA